MQPLHYLDLTLRPDPEQSPDELMSALYQALHRSLVQLRSQAIAVVFPQYRILQAKTVGDTLRLVGPPQALQALMALPWLLALKDHVKQTDATPVPPGAQPMRLERVQAKTSVDRLRRRAMKRHQLSAADAQERLPDTVANKRPNLPSVRLHSASTGQGYDLFLRLRTAEAQALGPFNSFGLSASATVPWF
jgi:CRISPR-associated endonuclease Csy4